MTAKIKKTGDFVMKSKHNNRSFIADARYVSTSTRKPVLLFVHGFKGFKDWGHFNIIADYFAERGFIFVKLNLSHNGTTPDSPQDFVDLEAFSNNTFSIELDDIGVLIDELFDGNLPVPPDEYDANFLHLIGHSRGGALVLLKTAEDSRVRSVIAWAPIHDLGERWSTQVLGEWKRNGIYYVQNGRTKQEMPLKYSLVEDVLNNPSRLNIPAAVKNMNRPMLIIHGTADETLSYQHSIDLANTNSLAQAEIIEGAPHVFGGRHPYDNTELPYHTQQALNSTLNFLAE